LTDNAPQEKKNNTMRTVAIGCGGMLLLTLLCVGAFVLYGVFRTSQDQALYEDAHQLYEAGNCEGALEGYATIDAAFRLSENEFTEAAAAEAEVCNAYSTVATETDPSAQLSGYRTFLNTYGDTPIADVAVDELNDVLANNPPDAFVNTQFCNDTAFLANPENVTNPGEVMPPIMLACGQLYESNEDFVGAMDLYRLILANYNDSAFLGETGEAIIVNAEPCFDADLRAEVITEAEEAGLNDYGADVLYNCAIYAREVEEYSTEVNFLDELQAGYPDYRSDEVEELLATALVNFAEQAGGGEIAQPDAVQTTGENSIVIVENASPTGIRIVFSGEERRVEVIEPCEDCVEDVSSCERTDLPGGVYELPPGTYSVVVEATSGDIIPFTGNWLLEGGFEYPNCFYIETGP
jgi:tetratricopeptide (TPR) repeat protein